MTDAQRPAEHDVFCPAHDQPDLTCICRPYAARLPAEPQNLPDNDTGYGNPDRYKYPPFGQPAEPQGVSAEDAAADAEDLRQTLENGAANGGHIYLPPWHCRALLAALRKAALLDEVAALSPYNSATR